MTKSSEACSRSIEALVATGTATFWTFTFDPGFVLGYMGVDHDESADQWDKCLRALRKAKPDLAGIRVFEAHKNGRLHIHAFFNGHLPIRWVKALASRFGCGRINCKKAYQGLGEYLSKYLRKGQKMRHRNFRKGRRLWGNFGKFSGKRLVSDIEVESTYGTFLKWWLALSEEEAEKFFFAVSLGIQGWFHARPLLPWIVLKLATRGQRWWWGKRLYYGAGFWKDVAAYSVLCQFPDALRVIPGELIRRREAVRPRRPSQPF